MYATKLRKVGGSIMLALPTALLEILHLRAGEKVGLTVEGNSLKLTPQKRPHYTMAELLAASDYSVPKTEEDKAWVNGAAAGKELL